MRPLLSISAALLVLGLACRERGNAVARVDTAVAAPSFASASTTRAVEACFFRPRDVRLGTDTIAGLPTGLTIGELRSRCATARLDTVGVGGTTALRWDAPGATVWAIQSAHDAYDDSLHAAERADLWAAVGDSVRFPDGVPIPQRVGTLRALDSLGVVVVDHGDDGTGSYIVRCRYPALAIVIGNTWPSHPRGGTASLVGVSTADTTRVWRAEVMPERRATEVEQACRRAREQPER
jgi:hypothetical protein